MGAVQLLPPPLPNVNNNIDENNMFIRVFDEQTRLRMPTAAFVDAMEPGVVYDMDNASPGGNILAGNVVSSHFLHFDTVGMNDLVPSGSLTFESDALGVMISGNPMFATEDTNPANGPFLGAAGTIYPTTADDPNGRRAWEIGGMNGHVMISSDRRTVSFSAEVVQFMDQMRIITAASPADVLAEPYVNSTGYLTGVDEVTADNCASAFY